MNGLSPSVEQFRRVASLPDEVIRLAEAALLVAAEEYRDLDVAHYLRIIDDLGASLKCRLRRDISPAEAIIALNHFLFEEHGFRGNTADYYDPRNSFLNEVLERRLGIPITLSILYIEVGRYIGLPLHGISFPAHFLVRCAVRDGAIVLDPYARGRSLSMVELRQRVTQLHAGRAPSPSALAAMLAAASNREILARMLRNLKGVYVRRRELTKALAAAERVLFVMPGLAAEYRDRGTIYLGLECFRAALEDFRRYLALAPHAEDAERIRECVAELELQAARLN